jgi:hypothetical protein
MLLMTVHALGEMAVMYPVNGAFFDYALRFIDPSWYVLRWWRSRQVGLTFSDAGVLPWVGIMPSTGSSFFPSKSRRPVSRFNFGERT